MDRLEKYYFKANNKATKQPPWISREDIVSVPLIATLNRYLPTPLKFFRNNNSLKTEGTLNRPKTEAATRDVL